jgi:hypothetical protein
MSELQLLHNFVLRFSFEFALQFVMCLYLCWFCNVAYCLLVKSLLKVKFSLSDDSILRVNDYHRVNASVPTLPLNTH